MRSLHCCCDAKFIMGMISLFESDPSVKNDYIIVSDSKKLKFVDPNVVKIVPPSKLAELCIRYDVVFIHYLKAHYFNIIPSLPKHIKVVWFAWGADMYDGRTAILKNEYFGSLTKEYYKNEFGGELNTLCRNVIFSIQQKSKRNKTLERIDYFSGVFPYEYDLLKSNCKNFKAKPLDFYYGSTNFFIPEKPEETFDDDKENVIVGNSAAYTNNHMDALYDLKKSGWESSGGKIIVPLSYGGNKKYVEKVIAFGKELFGDKIYPLVDYVPLDQYLKIISSCRIAIFYHKRQQASDNVFMQMMYGARVFMSKDNLMYKYLKSEGFKLFALEKEPYLINESMKEEDVLNNRKILSNNYSSSKLIDRITRINAELLK